MSVTITAQNSFNDEKEIINQELSQITQNRDSIFLYNRFNNKLLYDWFRVDKSKFDFHFASQDTQDLLFEMAKLKDAIKEVSGNILINSSYINNKDVYFLETNNSYIKSCNDNSTSMQYESFLSRDKVSISLPFFSKDRKSAVIYYSFNGSIYYSFYQSVENVWERKFNIIVTIA